MTLKKFKTICKNFSASQKQALADRGYKKGALVRLDNSEFGYDTSKLYIVVEVSGVDCPPLTAATGVARVKLLDVALNKFIYRHPSMPITVVKEGKDDPLLYVERDVKAIWKSLPKASKSRFINLYGGKS